MGVEFAGVGQMFPQDPQLLGSELILVQPAAGQHSSFLAQQLPAHLHRPVEPQHSPVGQHCVPQGDWPGPHGRHLLATQAPLSHLIAQPPQFVGSLAGLTHLPLQRSHPVAQVAGHAHGWVVSSHAGGAVKQVCEHPVDDVESGTQGPHPALQLAGLAAG